MEEQLKDYGLSEKEAKVYIACLKIGPSTANRISTTTNLRRSTTYDLLETLKAKGLISSFISGKKYHFQAAEPTEILTLLKTKERKLKEIIPKLQSIKATTPEKPRLELFEGFKSITTLLEEFYKEKELLIYGSAEKASNALKHLPKSLAIRRAEQKIKVRFIFEHSEYAEFRIKNPKIRKVTNMRFLKTMKDYPTVTFIAGEKVGIISLERELIGVCIQNKEISETQRLLFENLWKQAKL